METIYDVMEKMEILQIIDEEDFIMMVQHNDLKWKKIQIREKDLNEWTSA